MKEYSIKPILLNCNCLHILIQNTGRMQCKYSLTALKLRKNQRNQKKFTNKSLQVIYGRISYHQKIYNFSVINSNHFSLFNITNFFLV